MLGDKEAQDAHRSKRNNEYHCPWLRRDANACEALPDGIDGVEPGTVCPHNAYFYHADEIGRRDSVSDTLERLFRLIGLSDAGLTTETMLDPLSITELLAAKSELARQDNLRQKEAYNRGVEAEANKGLPSWADK